MNGREGKHRIEVKEKMVETEEAFPRLGGIESSSLGGYLPIVVCVYLDERLLLLLLPLHLCKWVNVCVCVFVCVRVY